MFFVLHYLVINVQMDDIYVQKSPSASIPSVVLDNFYKLNCLFVNIFRLTVSITW